MSAIVGSRAPVPSRNLLRFLRSQSNDTCFFTTNATCHLRQPADTASSLPSPSRRLLSTSSVRRAKLQPSYLDDLYPRHRDNIPAALPPPRHYPHSSTRFVQHPPHARHACTNSSRRQGFFRRLFAFRRRQVPDDDQTFPDVPFNSQQYEDTSAQLFNLSRALSRSPSGADLKLRC